VSARSSSTRERSVAVRLVVVLLLGVLAGCSGVKFAYHRIDWGIAWYAQQNVTLTATQEARLEAEIDALMQWHCESQLPAYARSFVTLASDIEQSPLAAASMARESRRLEDYWDHVMARAGPVLVDLLLELDDAQVEELIANLEEDLAERRAEYLSEPDAAGERLERLEKGFRRWIGRLNPDQREAIAAWAALSQPWVGNWIDTRETWIALFAATLRAQRDDERAEFLLTLITAPESLRSEAQRAVTETWRQSFVALLSNIDASLEPRQRRQLAGRLRDWGEDFAALACSADKPDRLETAALNGGAAPGR